ncbi:hypothetical protein HQ325_01280 [Rhodococcus sp. BP-349]|uniref:hypothetical protein n=1 Tax=unclassified Rhodococcus (in: high G+C Gram-positive bacteria) TaxID=192944 RepID=UPI001D39887B|nr:MULTISPECIES: hypothetical protein [unclassified Rhodococcus (in: high G+C Gram-positive bacteria)]MBY6537292.1 hypothetical protein [Rhodococcus sp. BP-363]MBY6541629.1 hypothetical protein [Rhodococcus sp. BP-369]MBY6560859.1 hypothetical protein [Rhodococcus sp. BP-370]MBY6575151.1 hypothetical protein [Rhodococcus sp. BP-364]MBY6584452.1 hypothetical protein [Rhodococcus sp. BP-358]
MFDRVRRRRAARRVRPGDGRALQPFRWWQLLGRALFHLPPSGAHEPEWSVDIRHWQDQASGSVTADLYRDGLCEARSALPAAFPVGDGRIEVAMSGFGVERCHLVSADGSERQLSPDPRSAEGRRARFDRRHPAASSVIGVVSIALVLSGVLSLAVYLVETVSRIPPIAESVGVIAAPIDLPTWSTVASTVGAAVGSTERALRLHYHWLDAAGN